MKIFRIALAAAAVGLAGCASATTKVLTPAAEAMKSSSLRIEHGADTVQVDEEFGSFFRAELAEALFGPGGFTDADGGVILRYRFVQADQGSRFSRYMLGPIAGKGSMAIEITYVDAAGTEMSRVETGGEVSGGFFGGSYKSALKKAAKETADYARVTFLP